MSVGSSRHQYSFVVSLKPFVTLALFRAGTGTRALCWLSDLVDSAHHLGKENLLQMTFDDPRLFAFNE